MEVSLLLNGYSLFFPSLWTQCEVGHLEERRDCQQLAQATWGESVRKQKLLSSSLQMWQICWSRKQFSSLPPPTPLLSHTLFYSLSHSGPLLCHCPTLDHSLVHSIENIFLFFCLLLSKSSSLPLGGAKEGWPPGGVAGATEEATAWKIAQLEGVYYPSHTPIHLAFSSLSLSSSGSTWVQRRNRWLLNPTEITHVISHSAGQKGPQGTQRNSLELELLELERKSLELDL